MMGAPEAMNVVAVVVAITEAEAAVAIPVEATIATVAAIPVEAIATAAAIPVEATIATAAAMTAMTAMMPIVRRMIHLQVCIRHLTFDSHIFSQFKRNRTGPIFFPATWSIPLKRGRII